MARYDSWLSEARLSDALIRAGALAREQPRRGGEDAPVKQPQYPPGAASGTRAPKAASSSDAHESVDSDAVLDVAPAEPRRDGRFETQPSPNPETNSERRLIEPHSPLLTGTLEHRLDAFTEWLLPHVKAEHVLVLDNNGRAVAAAPVASDEFAEIALALTVAFAAAGNTPKQIEADGALISLGTRGVVQLVPSLTQRGVFYAAWQGRVGLKRATTRTIARLLATTINGDPRERRSPNPYAPPNNVYRLTRS